MTDTAHLKRVLKPIHLWAIAVGLVISGEYFGWNLGWQAGGTIGFLIATLIITVMYITFIFSYTELTTAIPHAGGAFAYAYRAMGPFGSVIAGYATLIDFLFSTPAIAFALGAYLHFLWPVIPVVSSAIFLPLFLQVSTFWALKNRPPFLYHYNPCCWRIAIIHRNSIPTFSGFKFHAPPNAFWVERYVCSFALCGMVLPGY